MSMKASELVSKMRREARVNGWTALTKLAAVPSTHLPFACGAELSYPTTPWKATRYFCTVNTEISFEDFLLFTINAPVSTYDVLL